MKRFVFVLMSAVLFVFAGCVTNDVVEEEIVEPEIILPIDNPGPEGLVEVLDGFEEGLYWVASSLDCDSGIDADTTDDWSCEDEYSCSLLFDVGVSTFECGSLFFNDFTGYSNIYVDINNTAEEGIGFLLALRDGNGDWFESPEIKLGSGFNRNVKISLESMEIEDPSAVQYLYVRLFSKFGGKIFIDNIRIEKTVADS